MNSATMNSTGFGPSKPELFLAAAQKPSFFNNPSFFFQRSSQKSNLSFSHNANTSRSISKTTTWSSKRESVGGVSFTHRGTFFPGLGNDSLVFGTYGLGPKLKLAIETGIHDTLGIDLAASIFNNIITYGAKPLAFTCIHSSMILGADLSEKVIKGVLDGCKQSDCYFLAGKDIEVVHYYKDGEYDLVGFAGGVVDKDSNIDGKVIVAGDVLVGLPSRAVHWSGLSLVRRVLAQSGLSLKDQLPGGGGNPITLGGALMAPSASYVKQVLDIISKGGVKGIAHITGGGFTDTIPRVFPKGLGATIYKDSWEVPAVFKWIQEAGRIEDAEMRRTFNMGIGMILVVSPDAAPRILGEQHGGYSAYNIGEVTTKEGVIYQ